VKSIGTRVGAVVIALLTIIFLAAAAGAPVSFPV
jgi:hypothetical protein